MRPGRVSILVRAWAWIDARPMTVTAIFTTVVAFLVIAAPDMSASQYPAVNKAADILLRYNHLSLGSLFGWWLFWWFNVRREPRTELEAWSLKWILKRFLIALYVIGGMIAWASFVVVQ